MTHAKVYKCSLHYTLNVRPLNEQRTEICNSYRAGMPSSKATEMLSDKSARSTSRVNGYLPLGFSWSYLVSLGRRMLVTRIKIKLIFVRQTQRHIYNVRKVRHCNGMIVCKILSTPTVSGQSTLQVLQLGEDHNLRSIWNISHTPFHDRIDI
jgi:hypothetical protein